MVSVSIRKPIKIAAGISPIEAVRFTPAQKDIRNQMCIRDRFIGIMNFANTRISDMMRRQWECKILGRVGMTKKQEYRMFVTEGLFYW